MTLEAWVRPTALGNAWRTVVLKEQTGYYAYGLYATRERTARAATEITAPTATSGHCPAAAQHVDHLATTYDGSVSRSM